MLLGCSNDIAANVTAANCLIDLQTYYADAIAAGYDKCYIGTEIPRKNLTAPQEAERLALNASILSTFGSEAVDFAADNWQPGGAADWATNYQGTAVGIHPNAAGRALMAARFQSVVSGFL